MERKEGGRKGVRKERRKVKMFLSFSVCQAFYQAISFNPCINLMKYDYYKFHFTDMRTDVYRG
jgi:hypothetical protein